MPPPSSSLRLVLLQSLHGDFQVRGHSLAAFQAVRIDGSA
jgi:hypothetical protein